MQMRYSSLFLLAALLAIPTACMAQAGYSGGTPIPVVMPDEIPSVEDPERAAPVYAFRSRADSLEWDRERNRAARARGYRVIVDLFERQLHVIDGTDTLRTAMVAVGMADSVLVHEGRRWRFDTPRGRRSVLRKEANPVWVPPDWHYVEVAAELGLQLDTIDPRRPVRLEDGRQLVVRNQRVGLLVDGEFEPLPRDMQIIFDGKLFMPPFGTENRRIEGELGRFRLDLGNGYLLHGTPHEYTIGDAATHGCIRLFDEDIEWLYENVRIGTPVYIY